MKAPRMAIGPGSEVILHCRITLEDGTVAEDTHGDEPLCLSIGDGTLLQRLEQRLHGLCAGDHKSWDLAPHEAFGEHDPTNVRTLPRDRFPPDIPPAPGLVIAFSLPDGQEMPGGVVAVDENEGEVEVDFNHPLAGQNIRFEVEVVAVAAQGKLSGQPPTTSIT